MSSQLTERAVQTATTTCPYCGVGCGVEASLLGAHLQSVKGDARHPANLGRLCVKGSALAETLTTSHRMLQPQIGAQAVLWEQALEAVATGLQQTIAQYGPDSVAFYLSGQLLTEDYYVANKLMKGFIGSANVDTNSRLCMASAVVGHKRAFGADAVPACYEDIELADLVVIVGSNLAWAHPILFQRLSAAKEAKGTRVVVIDPRHTDTAELADLHLAIAPGSDVWLYNGLCRHLLERGCIDAAFVAQSVDGFTELQGHLHHPQYELASVAVRTGLAMDVLQQFFAWVEHHPRTLTLFSQGVNQSSQGTDKVNAIINSHLLTGRIGKPGAAPFSVTGQPNAMGGREVGGLANQLAAHMDFASDDVDRVGRFWQAAQMARQPGLKAVELFEAVEQGQIKAIWIMATNPVVSLPQADRVKAALAKCPLVIVSDAVQDNDTLRLAHIRLPATSWAEKDGTVTNSERCISRQRGLIPGPGAARNDWWIITEVARRMGFAEAFDYQHPVDIFREHAALSGFENDGQRAFDISLLENISRTEYDQLQPVQWPLSQRHPRGMQRLFGNGQFYTVNGRARLLCVEGGEQRKGVPDHYPLLLNTGRIRDQWHTMTRTGYVPRLLQHRAEPFVAVHPQDLKRLKLQEGDLAEVASRDGSVIVRIREDGGQQPGQVFIPMHWNGVFSAQARVDTLVAARLDPFSGQPEFKLTQVRLQRFDQQWQGVLLATEEVEMAGLPYWTRMPLSNGWMWRVASREPLTALADALCERYGQASMALNGAAGAEWRLAWFRDGRLTTLLFVSNQQLPQIDTSFLAEQLNQQPDASVRRTLLLGRVLEQGPHQGPLVCSCFQVDAGAIQTALNAGCNSVEALGSKLKCGTNCGSCIPELKRMVRAAQAQAEEAA
ncbi:nitrate reductase [Pokkaliibacter plantistimulans]|uniref:Nitrate reductase n=1 Tax=Pokkaliibacter plantistimulans TaxID=1635171 RepID=A0ABX5LSI8_9GAMM|nr:nitrate reductase [Pokkaliibacter plantistimulans]PXF29604.1 nitrate reductase [Pokkaliibacter plantistimulans]